MDVSNPLARILVVDDEPAVRRSSARLLSRAGYEVLEADSAIAALTLGRDGVDVDIILSDVVMPDMTGIDLLTAARQFWPDAEIILFSAFTPAALTRHRLDEGMDHPILQKPLEHAQLLEAIAAAVERSGD